MSLSKLSRRDFLIKTGLAAGALPWALNLAAIGDVAAAQGAKDYKALVCVFLFGGNDHANTLIPYDKDNYKRYQNIRQDIAIKRTQIQTLNSQQGLPKGVQLGLHPNLKQLKHLFAEKELAILLNVGALVAPTSLKDFRNQAVPLPPHLFSHNDQQSIWQSSQPEGANKGWGGALIEANRASYGQSLFSTVSLHGNAVLLAGENIHPYQCTGKGAIPMRAYKGQRLFGSKATSKAFAQLINQPSDNPFKQALWHTNQRAISAYSQLAPIKEFEPKGNFKEDNKLAAQLKYVAQMIRANRLLGVKRQVFFVGIGGYDTHADLLANHAHKMQELDTALYAFQQAIKAMHMEKQVTTFSASDFGRTFSVNGDGSDHGWGGHHFILGGAVKGGRFYGQMPDIGLNTQQDVGKGRLLPTTSIDQYATTLALWFGISASNIPLIAPNIGRFDTASLGFI